jgi:hypothetical protein
MRKRDKQIIQDLERFRVMSRDDIMGLYFNHLKNPITSTNTVLKRLVRDKQIEVSKEFSPYVYFPAGSTMKRDSTKIPHFLKLVEVYRQLKQHITPKSFVIEPKYEKGLAEPDIYTEIRDVPFFIELQRNLYSQKVMNDKIKRYEALYYSNEFRFKKFPFIIIISSARYEIESVVLTVFQVNSILDFMKNVTGKQKTTIEKNIKYKIG